MRLALIIAVVLFGHLNSISQDYDSLINPANSEYEREKFSKTLSTNDILEDIAKLNSSKLVYEDRKIKRFLIRDYGSPIIDNDSLSITFINCVFESWVSLDNVKIGKLEFINCTFKSSNVGFELSSLQLESFKVNGKYPILLILDSRINNVWINAYANETTRWDESILTSGEIHIENSFFNEFLVGSRKKVYIDNINVDFEEKDWKDEGFMNEFGAIHWYDSLPKESSVYFTDYLIKRGVNISGSSLQLFNSEFRTKNIWQSVKFSGSYDEFIIEGTRFESPAIMDMEVGNYISISSSEFHNYVSFNNAVLPEFGRYLPYRQFKAGIGVILDIPWKEFGDANPIDCNDCFMYTGVGDKAIGDTKHFELLINEYQLLYNNYKQRGEIESANASYVIIKDLQLRRYEYIYKTEGGFRNLFKVRLAQIIRLYTNHGTEPSLALLVSFYIIIAFAIFYFFFPSEWDAKSKGKLVSDFKDFIQKNEKGYVKPFFIMLGGFVLSLVNALTLSLNSFVTLGFGKIPTKGLARYVCIIQGFIGWFLLSIFTVALINQVLA